MTKRRGSAPPTLRMAATRPEFLYGAGRARGCSVANRLRCGCVRFERDRGHDEPSTVGRKLTGRQVCKGAALKVSDDLLDDRVGAVGLLGLEHGQWGVREHALLAVAGEQLTLPVRDRLGVQPPTRRTITGALMCSALRLS
jgi:hypothetical protein